MNVDARYLQPRETNALFEQRAFYALADRFASLTAAQVAMEKAALKELRRRFSYCEIQKCVEWVEVNKTLPDRQACPVPLSWLARGGIERVRAQVQREEIRRAKQERLREQLAETKAEQERADLATSRALAAFMREFPDPADRMRAMIRVYNVHRDRFGPATLGDVAGRAIALGILVEQIEALSRIAQDAKTDGGEGVALGKTA